MSKKQIREKADKLGMTIGKLARQPMETRVYGKPPMCEGCGVNRSDPPSPLCPGCQAYREHQA